MSTIPVYTAKDLAAKIFPKPAWLIEPLLQRGGDWLIAGEPNAFKSLFLMQLCIHASLGLDYLFLKIDEPLRILYINVDDNARIVQKRLRALTPKGQELNENFLLVCQPGIEFDPAGQEQVKVWTRDYRPDIVIFDHLSDLVVGGTIDQRGMQEYNKLQKWLCAQDMGVTSLTHLNRSTKENKSESMTRKIGGCNLIIGSHSVITAHEAHEPDIAHKYPRFDMTMERNKNLDEDIRQYNTTIEVVKVGEGDEAKTFLREV